MFMLVLLSGISLALSLLLIPACRGAAVRWNLVDLPDATRKIHRRPVPRIGGIPVVLATLTSCLIVALAAGRNGIAAPAGFSAARSVAPAALLIVLVGLADDVLSLRPWQKLAGQVLAGGIAVASGIHIRSLAGLSLHPWAGAAITIVWLVGCANALNLIDGVDGLAAGIALIACATDLVAAVTCGNMPLAIAIAPLTGALLGFLIFNFNPASIFLGDCGSLTLGFLLGCYGVLWSAQSPAFPGMTAPLIALAIPLLDTTLAIVRRYLRRKPIFGADYSHIHHRLLARGVSPRGVVLLLYATAGCAGALALLFGHVRHPLEGLVVIVLTCAIACGIYQMKYAEFGAVRRYIVNDTFRWALHAQLAVQNLEDRLSVATAPDECWAAIATASAELGFHRVEMRYQGRAYQTSSHDRPIRSWVVRIPISEHEWIELFHEFGVTRPCTSVAPFVETLSKVLGSGRSAPALASCEPVSGSSAEITLSEIVGLR
jgi:UDP-GlcNAc:undecaprenyl-phosphate/decaprenyl-phosphate GlcNAc-1-phosphate transferase